MHINKNVRPAELNDTVNRGCPDTPASRCVPTCCPVEFYPSEKQAAKPVERTVYD